MPWIPIYVCTEDVDTLTLVNTNPERITDPWAGWTERRAGADKPVPFFGAGHPGVFWLKLRTAPKISGHVCGPSSFEWIGNLYKVLGNAAKPETIHAWNRLPGRIGKAVTKVPGGQLSSSQAATIWAFPEAYTRLNEGNQADRNPV